MRYGVGVVVLACIFATDAEAAIWRWGCAGSLGKVQIVSNRYHLLVMPREVEHGKLEELIAIDDLTKDEKIAKGTVAGISEFDADDANSGLVKEMTFTSTDHTLTLVERSSKTIQHHVSLVQGCRDEIIDRFRKVYRYSFDDEPPREATLECMEYTLTTRGGRTCH
jgi:hypothetical protein